jgi:hypothetical protein
MIGGHDHVLVFQLRFKLFKARLGRVAADSDRLVLSATYHHYRAGLWTGVETRKETTPCAQVRPEPAVHCLRRNSGFGPFVGLAKGNCSVVAEMCFS